MRHIIRIILGSVNKQWVLSRKVQLLQNTSTRPFPRNASESEYQPLDSQSIFDLICISLKSIDLRHNAYIITYLELHNQTDCTSIPEFSRYFVINI